MNNPSNGATATLDEHDGPTTLEEWLAGVGVMTMRDIADRPELGTTRNPILVAALDEHMTEVRAELAASGGPLNRESLTLYVNTIARAWATQIDGPADLGDRRVFPVATGTGANGSLDLDWWTLRITAVCSLAITTKIVNLKDALQGS